MNLLEVIGRAGTALLSAAGTYTVLDTWGFTHGVAYGMALAVAAVMATVYSRFIWRRP